MAIKTQPFTDRQRMRNSTYEVFRYRTDKPKEVALHHHDFYEIYFFISGKVQYNIESRSYLLTPGDILLIRPMELHQPIFTAGSGGYERFVLWLDKHFLDQFGTAEEPLSVCFSSIAPGRANLLRPDENIRWQLQYELEQLILETEAQEYACKVCCMSYLAQILAQLCRLAKQEPQEIEPRDSSSVIYSILGHINDHFTEDLTLDVLANRFFISKYHLSREFARITGTSVHRYIVQKRLIQAKQMMSEGVPSTEVYQHCGFGDYSNFYRAFKSEFQMSPREFTANVKKIAVDSEMKPHFFQG